MEYLSVVFFSIHPLFSLVLPRREAIVDLLPAASKSNFISYIYYLVINSDFISFTFTCPIYKLLKVVVVEFTASTTSVVEAVFPRTVGRVT